MAQTAMNGELKRINDKIKHLETVIATTAKTGSLGMLERSHQIRKEILREVSIIHDQRDTAVKALEEIAKPNTVGSARVPLYRKMAKQALAALEGGEDEL